MFCWGDIHMAPLIIMTDNLSGAVDRYLNCYTDIIKKFPPDGQRQTSRYYDVDWNHTHILNKIAFFGKQTKNFTFADGQRMKKMLIDALDLADRKVEISNHLMDMVDDNMFKLNMNIKDIQKTRVCQNKPNKNPKRMLKWVPNYKEIDSDSNDYVIENSKKYSNTSKTKITRTSNKNIKKKANLDNQLETSETVLRKTNQKIKKTTKDKNPRTQGSKIKKIIISDSSDSDTDTDVQPTYCVCEKVSYGDMVCCDNDLCPIEWFHFGCVSLTRKPKGKWYCPRCRGTNSKLMKPRQVFFRELEEYNKRKEENWCIE